MSQDIILVVAVAVIGVVHTLVPDHWLPIVLIARQQGWSRSVVARVSLIAGGGHVLSTLVLAGTVWFVGAAASERLGRAVDTMASLALVAFGGWIAITAWWEGRLTERTRHTHDHHRVGLLADGGSRPLITARTITLVILGSSPMVEGIPLFFAANRYGFGQIALMAGIFAISTIGTYVAVCVSAEAGLRRLRMHSRWGGLERAGEMAGGVVISIAGASFWLWPVA